MAAGSVAPGPPRPTVPCPTAPGRGPASDVADALQEVLVDLATSEPCLLLDAASLLERVVEQVLLDLERRAVVVVTLDQVEIAIGADQLPAASNAARELSEAAVGTPAEPRMLEQQAQAAASRGRLEEAREIDALVCEGAIAALRFE